jgi:hypothetical protein
LLAEFDQDVNNPNSAYSLQQDGAYYRVDLQIRYHGETGRICWNEGAMYPNPYPPAQFAIVQALAPSAPAFGYGAFHADGGLSQYIPHPTEAWVNNDGK